MMRDDAVQIGPQAIDVRSAETFDPLRIPARPIVTAFSGLRALCARCGTRWIFRIFAYRFHRNFPCLPLRAGSCLSRMEGIYPGLVLNRSGELNFEMVLAEDESELELLEMRQPVTVSAD
jgi:hypothetical protein